MKIRSIAIYSVAAILVLLVSGVSAKADTLTVTWGEVNGLVFQPPLPYTQDAGSVPFSVPAGQSIVGAVFTSTFGNSVFPNTAEINVFVNGILVGSCSSFLDPCFEGASPTLFSYTFTSTDLLALGSGAADLSITQVSNNIIRLGPSTLTITTAPVGAPEPGSLALLGVGIFGLAALKLSKK